MNNINIREATGNDLAVLIEFEREIIQLERAFDNCLKEGETHYYNFQDLILSPETKVLVAEIDREIAGSGFAEIKKAESYFKHAAYGYIGLMYVRPQYRGKGINQQILQTLKEWLIGKQITEIRLVVYDENMPAKNAYQKAGFKGHVLEMRMEL